MPHFEKKIIFNQLKILKSMNSYWRTNLKYLFILLSIWFVVSFCAGILFKEELNQIRLGGFKLGFWFAQQGSILVFLALIFNYAWQMNKLDIAHGVDEE